MYEYIIKNQEEILYNGKHKFLGAIEELEQVEHDENNAGFSSREIIVRFLYFPKENKNKIEIKNNNEILARGKKYTIFKMSKEKAINTEFYNFHAFEVIKEDVTNKKINTIDKKIEDLIKKIFSRYIPFELFNKFKIKTQENYEKLPYPRCVYNFSTSHHPKSVTRLYLNDTKPVELYNMIYKIEFEFFSRYEAENTLWELKEFLINKRENGYVFREYFEKDYEIIEVETFGEITGLEDDTNYIKNQPRRRNIIGFELSVNYLRAKKVYDGEKIESLKIIDDILN